MALDANAITFPWSGIAESMDFGVGEDEFDFGLSNEITADAGAALDVAGRGADAYGLGF